MTTEVRRQRTCPHPERHQTVTYIPCQDCDYRANPALATEHEPVARAGESEKWSVEGGSLVGRRRIRGALNYWVADAASDQTAQQIVTEHNQHHSLLAERERLRKALRQCVSLLESQNELARIISEPHVLGLARQALNEQGNQPDQKEG